MTGFLKGNLSVSTTRLLKAVLPGSCLWTSLRDIEGLPYDKALKELKVLFPAGEDDDAMDDNVHGLTSSVPEAIRKMAGCREAVEALGSMIWYDILLRYISALDKLTFSSRYLRTLNIDKDILSMKNFNVYDPMKRGQGLVLDGQTLAHIEVNPSYLNKLIMGIDGVVQRFCSIVRVRRRVRCSSYSLDASHHLVTTCYSLCLI